MVSGHIVAQYCQRESFEQAQSQDGVLMVLPWKESQRVLVISRRSCVMEHYISGLIVTSFSGLEYL